MRFLPIYGRQAFKVDGRFTFWGGLTVEAGGGGPGLVDSLHRRRARRPASPSSTARARSASLTDEPAWSPACVRAPGRRLITVDTPAPSSWPPAASRPTRSGAPATSAPAGTWPRCAAPASTPATASGWRWRSAPARAGNWSGATPSAGSSTRRSSATSPSATGSRSTATRWASWSTPRASASSTRARTSATTPTPSTAGVILEQPGQFAWQVFDSKVDHLLRDEYRIQQVTKVTGEHAGGAGRARWTASTPRASWPTIARVQRRGRPDDRRSTRTSRTAAAPRGLAVDKTNWANTLDEPPFEAYAGHLRHHLHLRRPADHHRRRGRRRRRRGDPRPVRLRRDGRRHLLLQLSRAARA